MRNAGRRWLWVLSAFALAICVIFATVSPFRWVAGNILGEVADLILGDGNPEFGISEHLAVKGAPKDRAIILVHGILGHRIKTWTPGEIDVGIIGLLRKDSEIAGSFDVLTFGYPSFYAKKGSLGPYDAGQNLVEELRNTGHLKRYKEFVFVVHSMGGLVAMEAMSSSSDLFDKVSGAFALGVPFEGADIARWASTLLRNPALDDMVPKSPYLAGLKKRFADADAARMERANRSGGTGLLSGAFKFACGREHGAYGGLQVVSAKSSGSHCDRSVNSVADHVAMSKISTEDSRESLLPNALRYFLLERSGRRVPLKVKRTVDVSGSKCKQGSLEYSEIITDTLTFVEANSDIWYFAALPERWQSVEMNYQLEDSAGKQTDWMTQAPIVEESCQLRSGGTEKTCESKLVYQVRPTVPISQIRMKWIWGQKPGEKAQDSLEDPAELTNGTRYRLTAAELEVKLPSGIDFKKPLQATFPGLRGTDVAPTCESPADSPGKLICRGNPHMVTGMQVKYQESIPAGSLNCARR